MDTEIIAEEFDRNGTVVDHKDRTAMEMLAHWVYRQHNMTNSQ